MVSGVTIVATCASTRRPRAAPRAEPRALLRVARCRRYITEMRFERIWAEQVRATRTIRRRFGAKSALDYLIGEKLIVFADAARSDPKFAKELPRFLAAVWHIFNEYEIAGYVASRKPAARKSLRQLLYLR
jgi:hypothetical protein